MIAKISYERTNKIFSRQNVKTTKMAMTKDQNETQDDDQWSAAKVKTTQNNNFIYSGWTTVDRSVD